MTSCLDTHHTLCSFKFTKLVRTEPFRYRYKASHERIAGRCSE